jgi:hypothetical protein
MQASDIYPNRFQAMQAVVDEFIRRRPNDRIGAVVFGVDAYTLLPLTTDKEALRGVIAELELGNIDGQGTAIGNALGVSLNRLRQSRAASRVIILLTDGDSNSGNVAPEQAAEFAANMDVKVYTVLMGQSDEAMVQQGTDQTVVRTNRTPDGNGSLSRSRSIHEEGSHRVVRASTSADRRSRGLARGAFAGVLAPAAVLGAHVCRGTRSSHRGGYHGPKSKSCCGGPLAGRMGSR